MSVCLQVGTHACVDVTTIKIDRRLCNHGYIIVNVCSVRAYVFFFPHIHACMNDTECVYVLMSVCLSCLVRSALAWSGLVCSACLSVCLSVRSVRSVRSCPVLSCLVWSVLSVLSVLSALSVRSVLYVRPSVCPFVRLSVCLSACLYPYVCMYESVHASSDMTYCNLQQEREYLQQEKLEQYVENSFQEHE